MTDSSHSSPHSVNDSPRRDDSPPRQLPDTMSDLLETAISDARSLDPSKYHPHSAEWHSGIVYDACKVCLSGCVIAGTIAASPDETFAPSMFDEPTRTKLESLDCMRIGAWISAFKSFYGRYPEGISEKRLHSLPQPVCPDFLGWHAFRAHLSSLDTILPQLREIEREITMS